MYPEIKILYAWLNLHFSFVKFVHLNFLVENLIFGFLSKSNFFNLSFAFILLTSY